MTRFPNLSGLSHTARAFAALGLAALLPSLAAASGPTAAHFALQPNPKFVRCLAAFPDDPSRAPSADVFVQQQKLNDRLTIRLKNIKPGLKFDLFTTERTPLTSNGTVDPTFKANGGFGFAWYQSDLQIADDKTSSETQIRTIVVNQIFGLDEKRGVQPVNTFHVGFWFNSPADAADCGFTGTTPFNGDHTAGPLAMISVPDAVTDLGPLCLNPDLSSDPVRCNP